VHLLATVTIKHLIFLFGFFYGSVAQVLAPSSTESIHTSTQHHTPSENYVSVAASLSI
jgi:hypothetical protein